MDTQNARTDVTGNERQDPLDRQSLLEEVRYWDRLIDQERGRIKAEALARMEEQRAWALVRLFNLAGEQARWVH